MHVSTRLILPVVSLLLAVMASTPSISSDQVATSPYPDCSQAQDEAESFDCHQKRAEVIGKALQEAFDVLHEIHQQAEKPLAGLLRISQDHWEKWRDAKCQVDTYYSRGGTGYDVYLLDCLSNMNLSRIMELEEMRASP